MDEAARLEAAGDWEGAAAIIGEVSAGFTYAATGVGESVAGGARILSWVPGANRTRLPVANPTAQQLASARDLGVDARWVRADGSIDWPPNNGFEGPPTITEIQPGARFDRYGGNFDQNGQFVDTGGFVSPSGVPFDQRSLPSSSVNRPFQEYEVLQPIPNVNSGAAALSDVSAYGSK